MTPDGTRGQLRSFGFIVGAIFSALGLWPLIIRGDGVRLWMLALALILVVPALMAPGLLRPVYRVWMALGHVLGWINTRVVLGLIFFGLITPMAIAFRLGGRDPMQRTFDRNASTYRVPRTLRPGSHMLRQF
jgi:saxitoxin biosynthesis operon SxtJ-like protein